MGTRSSIKRLPPEIRSEVDHLIASGKHTHREIAAHIAKLGHAVSKSAVHRYSQDVEELGREMRYAKEMAEALGRELKVDAEHDIGRMLIETGHTLLLRMRLQLGNAEELDTEAVRDFAYSLGAITKARKDTAQTIAAERKLVVAEATKAVETVASELGLSENAIETFRTRLLGLQSRSA